MKKIIFLLYLSLHVFNPVMAETVEFSVGASYWNYSMDGDVSSPIVGINQFPFEFNDRSELNPFIVFKHPVSFLPNFKIQQNNIHTNGIITVSDPNFLNGQTVQVNGDFNFSHTDLVLFYEIMDNWLNVDIGISGKYFDGYQRFKYSTALNDELDFDHLIPMLYLQGKIDFPHTNLSVTSMIKTLSFDSNKVTDINLALQYHLKNGFGIELGYRVLDLDLKNISRIKSDLKVDGIYLSGFIVF